jgi:voltage-gated potassium channel Kch
MPHEAYQRLRRRRTRRVRLKRWLWREASFLAAVGRHLRWRFAILLLLLVTGGLLFIVLDPEARLSPVEAIYTTWSLVFGQPPGPFPHHPVLQALFFLVPILGLTIIIEGIIDLARVLRDRTHYERSWCQAMAHALSGHIVLVGLGRLGFRTWQLLNDLDEPVVVIESRADAPFLDELRVAGTPFFIGDGRRDELLLEAGIARARSIILATDDDLAHMEMALDARRLNPKIRVVLRMFDQALADKIREGFNIHLAMSQSAISAPAFATAALDATMTGSFVVGGELIVLQRRTVDDAWKGRRIDEIGASIGGVVVELVSGGAHRLFPPADHRVTPGDQLLLQAPFDNLRTKGATSR